MLPIVPRSKSVRDSRLARRPLRHVQPRSCSCWSVLAWAGKRVSYEQSINSFFAEDDPYMAVYQQAAETFGDDNFVFLVYDDPELLTPAGHGPGLASWRRRSGPSTSRPCSGSSRSTRCRCSGRSTTPCWRSTACPEFARNLAMNAAKQADQEHRPEDERDDGRRGGPRRGRRPAGARARSRSA